MSRKAVVELICCLLILLWVYAALSKLIDYDQSRKEMINQVFPKSLSEILVWAVPATELLISTLLIIPRSRTAGLYGSSTLLVAFTIYILVIMSNAFGRIPCSCGGVLEKMNWSTHFFFNIGFISLCMTAIYLIHKDKGANKIR